MPEPRIGDVDGVAARLPDAVLPLDLVVVDGLLLCELARARERPFGDRKVRAVHVVLGLPFDRAEVELRLAVHALACRTEPERNAFEAQTDRSAETPRIRMA